MRNLNSIALARERCFELRIAFGPRSLPFSSSSVLSAISVVMSQGMQTFSQRLCVSAGYIVRGMR